MHNIFLFFLQVVTIVKCLSVDYHDDIFKITEQASQNDTKKINIEIFNSKNQKAISFKVNATKNYNNASSEEKGNDTNQNSPRPCQDHLLQNSKEDESSTTLINYPFSVSIQRKRVHYASGALIANKWILSTAEDFYNIRESIKLYRVRLGSVDCKNGGTVLPIQKIELHPSYIYGQPNFDLGLLKTAQLVVFTDYIKPIALSRIRTKVISAKFMVTYWPRVVVKGIALPETAKERRKHTSMRVSTQRLIPHVKCSVQMYNMLRNTTLHESTLCLKPFVTHHSPCLPDAGAPVIAEDGLWGITSGWTSRNCHKTQSPTVFSRVGSLVVRVWLDAILLAQDWNSNHD